MISHPAHCTRNMVSEPRHGPHLPLDYSPERYETRTVHNWLLMLIASGWYSTTTASQRIRASLHTRCISLLLTPCSRRKGWKRFAKFENSRNSLRTVRSYLSDTIGPDDNFLSELQTTPAALALAWVAKNPNTSTVILGATRSEQITENLKALDVLPKLTDEIMEKIEKILNNKPAPVVRTFHRRINI